MTTYTIKPLVWKDGSSSWISCKTPFCNLFVSRRNVSGWGITGNPEVPFSLTETVFKTKELARKALEEWYVKELTKALKEVT